MVAAGGEAAEGKRVKEKGKRTGARSLHFCLFPFSFFL
jgi:hypothetical protein